MMNNEFFMAQTLLIELRLSSTWNFLSRMRLSLRDFKTCTPYTPSQFRDANTVPSASRARFGHDRLELPVALGNVSRLFPSLPEKSLERGIYGDRAVHFRI